MCEKHHFATVAICCAQDHFNQLKINFHTNPLAETNKIALLRKTVGEIGNLCISIKTTRTKKTTTTQRERERERE